MKYVVLDIIEPDFGCEGLPDGSVIMDDVVIKSEENGSIKTIKVPDSELYIKEIDVGTMVIIMNETLFKA